MKIIKTLKNKKVLFMIFIIITFRVLIPLITLYLKVLEKCFQQNYHLLDINNFIDCFRVIGQNKIIVIIYLIIALIFLFLLFNVKYTKRRLKIENEGIKFKQKDGTYGTANFVNPRDINLLKIGNEEKTPGIILGKTIDTGEIITLPDSCKSINRNIMIWGASGSGKSTSYIIPNALKIAEHNSKERIEELATQGVNVVCTDPKGELYSATSNTFRKAGYDVKIFNLVNPEHSDGIDLIKFIEKEIDAQVFAQVVISTTQNAGKKGEEFWQNTQENLLKALLLHIKFEVEDESKKNMRYLNSILASRQYK